MSASPYRVALVSREVAPFGGGGIGRYVRDLAALLEGHCELTIFTTSRHQRAHARARRSAPATLPRARMVFVREPRSWDARGSFSLLHTWSARVHAALVAEYGSAGPDLVEFCDFLGEGCVTAQAKRTGSPALRQTTVCVRLHGTAEIYDVLDGFLPSEPERSFTYELERYALAFSDVLLWAGGDVLGTYERYYGSDELATAERVRHPLVADPGPPPPRLEPATGPLRLLYLGRLERRKGVRALADALLGLESSDWRLTMIGADTQTAPLGGSMRALLEAELAADPRVRILDAVPGDEIAALIDAHDALVVPSRWECWPYVALEAIGRGTPVLATATGGLTEIVSPAAGWLASGTSPEALAEALAPLVADPAPARDAELARTARERCGALTSEPEIRDAYLRLCERRAAPAPVRAEPPLVSIVIPYFELDRYIAETVDSALAQTYPRTEIVIVNDGSFRPEDEILLELEARHPLRVVAQPNAGLGAARNLGVDVSHGEYVLPLDADNLLEPGFVARCVEALEADPAIACVGSWLRYVDADGAPWKGTEELLRPLGNASRAVDRVNVAGDAVAVFRRSVFESGLRYSTDVTGFEDWTLYREMRRRGLIGHVIPEPLVRYRLRDDSMMRAVTSAREDWARQAIDAHLAESAVDWVAPA